MHYRIVSRNNIIVSALAGSSGTSRTSIITSAIVALISFFYIYTVSSYFNIKIIYLQNRVTHDAFFSNIYLISRYIDHIVIASGTFLWLVLSIKEKKLRVAVSSIYGLLAIIAVGISNNNNNNIGSSMFDVLALVSVPIILSFWAYDICSRSLTEKSRNILDSYVNGLVVNYISILGIIIGIASIAVTLAINFFSVPLQSIPIRNYSYDIFLLLGNFSPFLMFLLISSFPVKILINEFLKFAKLRIKRTNSDSSSTISNTNKTNSNYNNNGNTRSNNSLLYASSSRSNGSYISLRKKVIFLALFSGLSIIIALVPQAPTINKNNQQIGVDTQAYIDWLNPLVKSNNFQQFTKQASAVLLHQPQPADRPLSILFLFAIVKVANNPNLSSVIEHVPVILAPALVLATFFLTRELTSNDTASLLAAFLTTISYHILIGIFASYHANWLALIMGYLSIAFLIRFLKGSGNTNNKINFAAFFVLLVLLQFAHVYTWTVLTLVLGIFLVVMLKVNHYNNRKKVAIALLSLVCLVVVDIAILTILTSSSAIGRDLVIARQAGVGFQQFSKRWDNLVYITQIYFIGLFGNFIILSLGLYWLYRSKLNDPSTIFLVIFLSTGLLPLFFGDVVIQVRVLYNIAFQMPAAIALNYIRQYRQGGNIMMVSICIWILAISIRTVSNFATNT